MYFPTLEKREAWSEYMKDLMPRTASTLIRSRASSSASQNSALTLVNFTCSIMWSFSRPKL